jgi:DNA-binding MarR family transcriptional regulator
VEQVPTRWLSPLEQRAWRAFVAASQLLFDQLDRELQQRAGISHASYGVLVVLSEQPQRALRMTDLARYLRFAKTRLSEAVRRMEARGWVRREPCPTDRRGTFAVLTDAGLAALEAAVPIHVEGVRRHLLDLLTPEQLDELGAISRAIAQPLMDSAGFSL